MPPGGQKAQRPRTRSVVVCIGSIIALDLLFTALFYPCYDGDQQAPPPSRAPAKREAPSAPDAAGSPPTPSNPKTPIIEVRNVAMTFAGRQVLKDGKPGRPPRGDRRRHGAAALRQDTLLRLLMVVYRPEKGEGLLFGKDIGKMSPRRAHRSASGLASFFSSPPSITA